MMQGHLDRSQTAVFDHKRYCTKECNDVYLPAFANSDREDALWRGGWQCGRGSLGADSICCVGV
jgi:hypothetical protein